MVATEGKGERSWSRSETNRRNKRQGNAKRASLLRHWKTGQNGRCPRLVFLLEDGTQDPVIVVYLVSIPQSVWYHQQMNLESRKSKAFIELEVFQFALLFHRVMSFSSFSILYFTISHNKLCLPPKFCINYCCEMLSWICSPPKSIWKQ